MTKAANVSQALFTQCDNVLNALGFNGRIDYPDLPFKAPAALPGDDHAQPYIEVRHFRGETETTTLGPEKAYSDGILQIAYVDFSQGGEIPAMAVMSQIVDQFQKGQEFWYGSTRVVVMKPPSILSVVQEGQRASYPLSIRYRASG